MLPIIHTRYFDEAHEHLIEGEYLITRRTFMNEFPITT
jgi:hypothetical protein